MSDRPPRDEVIDQAEAEGTPLLAALYFLGSLVFVAGSVGGIYVAGGAVSNYLKHVEATSILYDSKADARQAVKAHLKDPSSAQFGEITRYADGDQPRAYCGTVNARNTFGGYGGYQRFIRVGNGDVIIMEEESPRIFQGFWTNFCHDGPVAPRY
jgi:hypothetical protein